MTAEWEKAQPLEEENTNNITTNILVTIGLFLKNYINGFHLYVQKYYWIHVLIYRRRSLSAEICILIKTRYR